MRGRSLILSIYVLKEFLLSFFVGFAFFFFIFIINHILLLAEEILSKNVGVGDVLLLIFYSLPSIVALTFPFASLIGTLMTIGRLSSDNEILAFQASGVPVRKLFAPLFAAGLSLSVVSFFINDYFLPLGTINFLRLYRELIFSSPELELEPYTVTNFQNSIIITGRVTGRTIENIIIIDQDSEEQDRIILASSASLDPNYEDLGVVSMNLMNVFVQSNDPQNVDDYEYSRADEMIYNILLQNITSNIRAPGPREMSTLDLYREIQSKRLTLQTRVMEHEESVRQLRLAYTGEYYAALEDANASALFRSRSPALLADIATQSDRTFSDRTLSIYLMEYYKKYSIPVACVIFIFLAFPIGSLTRKSGRTVGFGIGLLFSVLYWSLLFAGQTVGYRMDFSPFWSIWLPDIVIFLVGSVLLVARWKR